MESNFKANVTKCNHPQRIVAALPTIKYAIEQGEWRRELQLLVSGLSSSDVH